MELGRRAMLRWCSWFFAGNAVIFMLIGLRYLQVVPWLYTGYLNWRGMITAVGYLIVSYVGWFSVLAFVPTSFVLILILLYPKPRLIFVTAIILASLSAYFLILDTVVYGLYRFHLNGIVLNLFITALHYPVFDLSRLECGISIAILIAVFILEMGLASWLWRRTPMFRPVGKWFCLVVMLCVYFSYAELILRFSTPRGHVLLETSRIFPMYANVLDLMIKENVDREFEAYFFQPDQAYGQLHYPLHSLQFNLPQKHYNLLVIGIDAWRFDMLNAEVTPYLFQYAKQAWVFQNHWSGGNSTGPGVFSLFYGMPSLYWTAMKKSHQGPVLLDALLKQHYQTSVFLSESIPVPKFSETVFQAISDKQDRGVGEFPDDRDRSVTSGFNHFLDRVEHRPQPFFSFLFYDAAHSYCLLKNADKPFQPNIAGCYRAGLSRESDPVLYLNRYKNALVGIDNQIRQVMASLKQHHQLENTIVIITGDHGEEFDDNHLGFWGHAGNYTRYQVQTPLIVYWPGEKPKVFSQVTSHFDVVPTLMQKIFGCQNPPDDYSIGASLLSKKSPAYSIVASYVGFGILERDQITSIFPAGRYEITQLSGQPRPSAALRPVVMRMAFQDFQRFYSMVK